MENSVEAGTLFAVALAGEETYWLCQPISGRRPPPGWKKCTCQWLYLINDTDIRRHIPWYEDHLGVVLELGVGETSKVERFAVITDSVKATKVVVEVGRVLKTYFILGHDERDVLDAKFDEFLNGEMNASTSKVNMPTNYEKSHDKEGRHAAASCVSVLSNGKLGGNGEVFLWNDFYIVEYGNRIFYVCSAACDNTYGFKVERLIRKDVTIFLLFYDEESGPCRIGTTHGGEKVAVSSVLEGGGGKVMVFMTEPHVSETTGKSKRKNCIVHPVCGPPLKTQKRENVKDNFIVQRSLRAVGVNLWVDYDGSSNETVKLVDMFPFLREGKGPLRTAVFSDGTCVTYDSVTAAKFAGKKKAITTSVDCDMAGLLENIKLAKEQFNST